MNIDLILRNVRPMGGALVDVAISGGRIIDMGEGISLKAVEIDGRGNALIPGLADHHIHLLATAARMDSVDLKGLTATDAIISKLRERAETIPSGAWVRAVNYDERAAGLIERDALDAWLPHHKLRMQDRTGALWMLNTAGVAALGNAPYPEGVYIARGHIWRQDKWLRDRIGGSPPDLAMLGQALARCGITHVTDAGAHNGPEEANILAEARESGALPQKLMMMGPEDLPASAQYASGPLKLHFDEYALPPVDHIAARIAVARSQSRNVAAHCVTLGELVFYLAALDAAGGAKLGDRIEHGGIIPETLISDIAARSLIVVSQPGFIHDRGDRYLAELTSEDQVDLYRLSSLAAKSVKLAAGSDAPYASFAPWVGIKAAMDRRTAKGEQISPAEALSPLDALSLYLGRPDTPHLPRAIAVGEPADLVLLNSSLAEALKTPSPDQVRMTLIDGKPYL